MTHPCPGPVLPSFDEITADELAKVIGGPLRCQECGGELELRCGAGHLHHAPRSRDPNIQLVLAKLKLKPCPGCGDGFEPRRYQRRCDRCSPPSTRTCLGCGNQLVAKQRRCLVCNPRPLTPRSNRTYPPKTCSCGATFTPTGPNSPRCPKCRGIASEVPSA